MLASAAIAFSLGFLQSPSRLLPRRAVTTAASTVMCTTLSDAQLAQYLVRTTLMELPGWEDGGKGIARPALAELIDEWDEDESEEFEEAIEALEEAYWQRRARILWVPPNVLWDPQVVEEIYQFLRKSQDAASLKVKSLNREIL